MQHLLMGQPAAATQTGWKTSAKKAVKKLSTLKLQYLWGKFSQVIEESLLAQNKTWREGEKRKLAEETSITRAKWQAASKHSLKLSRDNGEAGKWRKEEVKLKRTWEHGDDENSSHYQRPLCTPIITQASWKASMSFLAKTAVRCFLSGCKNSPRTKQLKAKPHEACEGKDHRNTDWDEDSVAGKPEYTIL